MQRNHDAKAAAQFIEQYRSSLSAEVFQSSQYAFRAFLIQVANHPGQDVLPIQFVHYDKLTDEQKGELGRFVAMVKVKQTMVANVDTMSAGEVVRKVKEALGNPKVMRAGRQKDMFTIDWHTRCWKHFKVRPAANGEKPDRTDSRYCVYDRRHNDFGYTADWVKLLVEQSKDGTLYDQLYPKLTR